ncbi:MAG: cation transporter [Acidobacteria bacterium]|nr:cation transporter [Acidobacteriota bacterium]
MPEVNQSSCFVANSTHNCYSLSNVTCISQTDLKTSDSNSTNQNHNHTHSHNHSNTNPHSHSHSHISDLENIGLKLKISTLVTVLFVVAQVITGFYTNSIALISDGVHNFTDALALIIALLSIWLQKFPVTLSKTYGYNRAGILAAFINSSSLMVIVALLCYESVLRIFNPQPIETTGMFWIAVLGLIVNVGIGLAIHKESKHDITIRSAYIHMLGDAASTVGIIIGSLIIYYTGYNIVDPIISLGISILILWTSWTILQETVHLLLEGTPKGINVETVSKAIEVVPGVKAVHHIHIWAIASQVTALSCHIEVDDMNLSNCQKLLLHINNVLKQQFEINHTTLQFETSNNS